MDELSLRGIVNDYIFMKWKVFFLIDDYLSSQCQCCIWIGKKEGEEREVWSFTPFCNEFLNILDLKLNIRILLFLWYIFNIVWGVCFIYIYFKWIIILHFFLWSFSFVQYIYIYIFKKKFINCLHIYYQKRTSKLIIKSLPWISKQFLIL